MRYTDLEIGVEHTYDWMVTSGHWVAVSSADAEARGWGPAELPALITADEGQEIRASHAGNTLFGYEVTVSTD